MVPFFRKNIGPVLKSFASSFVKILSHFFKKNWKSVASDFAAFSIDKISPNTGTIVSYLISAISSFGSLVSFVLDLSDNNLDGFYRVKLS